ncbi:hypothetical protein JOF56_009969 [Kibdelosporangium banguiense]|uniref:Uncharacterized protein n=1 Tax=Kibdelosporangium banguiense TaxID=1365924 RepID=A0ABS4TYU9_9PSEU|nr:hypothetical protein [Kibdelosporangium banguiense]MBP2329584.1 hypothetical protein [Kibdelosporangium banguiense]
MNIIVLLIAIGVGLIAAGTCLAVFADEIARIAVKLFRRRDHE